MSIKNTTFKEALRFILDTREALDRGVLHYNKKGKLLKTERAIVECLLDEGTVTFDPYPVPKRRRA